MQGKALKALRTVFKLYYSPFVLMPAAPRLYFGAAGILFKDPFMVLRAGLSSFFIPSIFMKDSPDFFFALQDITSI